MSQTLSARLVACAALAVLLAPASAFADDAAAGKTKYDMFCASCHGPTGKGDGPVAIAIQPPPRDFSDGSFKFDTDDSGEPGSDDDLKNVITNGAGKYGGNMMMAPWGGTMSSADVENVVAFIRSLKK